MATLTRSAIDLWPVRRNPGCPQKDDAPEILEKMVQADVIVLATPVYFYNMSGRLKTLIDRCCARFLEMENKEFYFNCPDC